MWAIAALLLAAIRSLFSVAGCSGQKKPMMWLTSYGLSGRFLLTGFEWKCHPWAITALSVAAIQSLFSS